MPRSINCSRLALIPRTAISRTMCRAIGRRRKKYVYITPAGANELTKPSARICRRLDETGCGRRHAAQRGYRASVDARRNARVIFAPASIRKKKEKWRRAGHHRRARDAPHGEHSGGGGDAWAAAKERPLFRRFFGVARRLRLGQRIRDARGRCSRLFDRRISCDERPVPRISESL